MWRRSFFVLLEMQGKAPRADTESAPTVQGDACHPKQITKTKKSPNKRSRILSRRDKKDTLSQNSSDFLFALLGQSWRPLQHPFQIVGARYFPYGKRMLLVSPIKQQSI